MSEPKAMPNSWGGRTELSDKPFKVSMAPIITPEYDKPVRGGMAYMPTFDSFLFRIEQKPDALRGGNNMRLVLKKEPRNEGPT